MSERPTQESSEVTSPSLPPSRATSSRPLQSVRVSTNPSDHDSTPTSSQSGDRITLTGLAPAPLSTPAASAPPSNAAPQANATSPEPAPVTLASDAPRARSERPAAALAPGAPAQAPRARWRPVVAAAACAALALGAIWLAWPSPRISPESAATTSLSTQVLRAGEKLSASSPTPATAAVAALTATPAANPDPAPPEGRVNKITIQAKPPGAKFLVAGKEVAETVLNLELPVGERRTFEVILEGYATRKLVVDGSKSEMLIVMMPEKRAATDEAAAKDRPAAEHTSRGETASAEAR